MPDHCLLDVIIRQLRRGWSVTDGQILVAAATRDDALARFNALRRAEISRIRPRCGANACDRASVAVFNLVWLCAEHCNAALDELRNSGLTRPIEFVGDVGTLLAAGDARLEPLDLAGEDTASH